MGRMSETPNPGNSSQIKRAAIIGAVLAAGGVVLFALLWVLLGRFDLDNFPRLILSMCVPPALIALAVGIYFLSSQPRRPQ
jgi:drug/metabolite transporter (DMT)-like permease